MNLSILTSTKKALGIDENYDVFDSDITMHINSVFFTLNQLGIGPAEGFSIEDASVTWDAFLGTDPRLNSVKTYVYLRVRLLFDPPSTSFHLAAIKEQIQELEWRLTVVTTPVPVVEPILDGGDPYSVYNSDSVLFDGGSVV